MVEKKYDLVKFISLQQKHVAFGKRQHSDKYIEKI